MLKTPLVLTPLECRVACVFGGHGQADGLARQAQGVHAEQAVPAGAAQVPDVLGAHGAVLAAASGDGVGELAAAGQDLGLQRAGGMTMSCAILPPAPTRFLKA